MADFDIAAGETVTVASGDTEEGGPLNIDGTLNLDGTFNVGEVTLAASVQGGATTTALVEATIQADASAGATTAATLDSLVPLRRVTSATISNDRTDDFTVQGVGETE